MSARDCPKTRGGGDNNESCAAQVPPIGVRSRSRSRCAVQPRKRENILGLDADSAGTDRWRGRAPPSGYGPAAWSPAGRVAAPDCSGHGSAGRVVVRVDGHRASAAARPPPPTLPTGCRARSRRHSRGCDRASIGRAVTSPRLFDSGLQPERTALAWRRTALGIALGSLVALRVLPAALHDPLWYIPGTIGIGFAAWAWWTSRDRYAAFARHVADARDEPQTSSAAPLLVVAVFAVAVGIVGLLAIVLVGVA